MAHIPYGYRIQRGKAVPEESEVKILNDCINLYLSGLSVKAAQEATGLPMSPSGLNDFLKKGVFAGTDYYPPIVADGVYEQILKTMEERTHPGTKTFSETLPVYEEFVLAMDGILPENGGENSSAIEALYQRIQPSMGGRKVMTKEEIARARMWLQIKLCHRTTGFEEKLK